MAAAVAAHSAARPGRRPLLLAGVAAVAVVGGLLAGQLGAGEHGAGVAAVALLVVPLLVWRWPEAGIALAVLSATLVEQFPLTIRGVSDGTSSLPLFAGLSQGAGISGLSVNPFEVLIAIVLLVAVVRAVAVPAARPRGALARSIGILVALTVVVGLGLGSVHGGDMREALWEIRPWAYLGALYLTCTLLARGPRAVDVLLWSLVIGTGIKGLQGIRMLLVAHSIVPRPEAILAHEESFFFGLYVVIVAGLWLLRRRGWLRRVATALLPAVLLSDVGNTRRVAWLILAVCLAAVLLIVHLRVPSRRRLVRRMVAVLCVATAVYLPAFWNVQGNLGQPARAVRTIIDPSARDQGSDRYRQLENANLGVNISEWRPLGSGFGIPIHYVVPIVDISQTDSLIRFVPHNGVLDMWMRLGWEGMLAFWAMVAAAIAAGCGLTLRRDPRSLLLGTVVVAAVLAYVIMGYEDLGLFWFRIAAVMGCLLGVLEGWRRLAPADAESAPQPGQQPPAPQRGGRRPRQRQQHTGEQGWNPGSSVAALRGRLSPR
jgi:hypothetical protein